jgi:ABC-type transporter Mla subunit MlaD
MRRVVALLVLAGAITVAVVLSAAGPKVGPIATYKIEFDNIFGLTEGGDMTVAGIKAGKTPRFELTDDERPKALVIAEISKPGFTPFRADAHCDIRQQSLIGTYYVSCQPGRSPRKLPDGAVIPVEQTTSTIPIDLVNNIMRRPYKERFRILLAELGTGLAGRPQDIQEVLQRAHPGLRETSKTLKILGDQNQTLKRFIRDADTVVEELEGNKNDVARFVREAGETAEIAATRQQDIRRGFQLLPGFLRELRPTMARLGELSDAQVPLLVDLQQAAPELNRFLVETEPFARATRPALRSLGRTSETGLEAIEQSDEEIRQLRRLAEPLPQRGSAPSQQGVTRPLRQLLVSLDDRNRSIESDRRAQDTAPPSPDPTAYRSGKGFTGMEAFWNYTYWQALAINIFDDTSHYLRVLGVAPPGCTDYTAMPEDGEQRDDCNSYIGDYQPCIPGQRQPPASIRNRDEICGGESGASSAGDEPAKAEKSAAPEPTSREAARPPTRDPASEAAAAAAEAPAPATPAKPNAATRSTPPTDGTDKELELMDYFLGR